MEKNRWSLIFIGLCLALAFSVSPVEAQLCDMGAFCDRDGDGYIKDHRRCTACLEAAVELGKGLDCDDDDGDVPEDTPCEVEPGPATVTICHFSPNRKHCGGKGGLERTIQINKLDGHLDHGDCVNLVGAVDQYNLEDCSGHCQAENPFGDNHDCSNLNLE